MIRINKSREPISLTTYRSQAGAVYDGPNFTPVKDAIRLSLLQEQGYVCAYCMRRIKQNNMKVEHYRCQNAHKQLQLCYTNLFACCDGNEGNPVKSQTCDTRKGSKNLTVDLLTNTPNISNIISYSTSGKIKSSNATVNSELNDVLNLNQSRLVANRKALLEAVEEELGKKAGGRTSAEITTLLRFYTSRDTNQKFKEYYGVAKFYLEKKLRRTQ